MALPFLIEKNLTQRLCTLPPEKVAHFLAQTIAHSPVVALEVALSLLQSQLPENLKTGITELLEHLRKQGEDQNLPHQLATLLQFLNDHLTEKHPTLAGDVLTHILTHHRCFLSNTTGPEITEALSTVYGLLEEAADQWAQLVYKNHIFFSQEELSDTLEKWLSQDIDAIFWRLLPPLQGRYDSALKTRLLDQVQDLRTKISVRNEADLTEALEEGPDPLRWHLRALERAGRILCDIDQDLETFKAFTSQSPRDQLLLANRMLAYKNPKTALEILKQAHLLTPQTPEGLNLAFEAYKNLENWEALQELHEKWFFEVLSDPRPWEERPSKEEDVWRSARRFLKDQTAFRTFMIKSFSQVPPRPKIAWALKKLGEEDPIFLDMLLDYLRSSILEIDSPEFRYLRPLAKSLAEVSKKHGSDLYELLGTTTLGRGHSLYQAQAKADLEAAERLRNAS